MNPTTFDEQIEKWVTGWKMVIAKHGEKAKWELWEWSNRTTTPITVAEGVFQKLGYIAFAGYPLQSHPTQGDTMTYNQKEIILMALEDAIKRCEAHLMEHGANPYGECLLNQTKETYELAKSGSLFGQFPTAPRAIVGKEV